MLMHINETAVTIQLLNKRQRSSYLRASGDNPAICVNAVLFINFHGATYTKLKVGILERNPSLMSVNAWLVGKVKQDDLITDETPVPTIKARSGSAQNAMDDRSNHRFSNGWPYEVEIRLNDAGSESRRIAY
jgi:hypothetical protein